MQKTKPTKTYNVNLSGRVYWCVDVTAASKDEAEIKALKIKLDCIEPYEIEHLEAYDIEEA